MMRENVTPQRLRKRPVEIEAMRYDGTNADAIRAWAGKNRLREIREMHAPLVLAIYTLEGVMRGDVGDWIVRGVQGEFYPVKPDTFGQTYEPVESQIHGDRDHAGN